MPTTSPSDGAANPGPRRRNALALPACAVLGAGGLSACGGSGDEGDGSGGPVSVPVADVPVGGGVVSGSVVVTQPTKGDFRAFDVTCPHQGCAVGSVGERGIVCPCHGSTFDPETGEPTAGPASSGLGAREVSVEGETLTVS